MSVNSFAHILCYCFMMLFCCLSSLFTLDLSSLSDTCFAKISSHPTGSLFTSLTVSYKVTIFFFFLQMMQSYLTSFAFVDWAFGFISKKSLLQEMSSKFLPVFSSRRFVFIGLSIKSSIPFELKFVCSVMWRSSFIVWHVNIHWLWMQKFCLREYLFSGCTTDTLNLGEKSTCFIS